VSLFVHSRECKRHKVSSKCRGMSQRTQAFWELAAVLRDIAKETFFISAFPVLLVRKHTRRCWIWRSKSNTFISVLKLQASVTVNFLYCDEHRSGNGKLRSWESCVWIWNKASSKYWLIYATSPAVSNVLECSLTIVFRTLSILIWAVAFGCKPWTVSQ